MASSQSRAVRMCAVVLTALAAAAPILADGVILGGTRLLGVATVSPDGSTACPVAPSAPILNESIPPANLHTAPQLTASSDRYTLTVQAMPAVSPGKMWWRAIITAKGNDEHRRIKSISYSAGSRVGQHLVLSYLTSSPGFIGFEYKTAEPMRGPLVVVADVTVSRQLWLDKKVRLMVDVPLPARPTEACIAP